MGDSINSFFLILKSFLPQLSTSVCCIYSHLLYGYHHQWPHNSGSTHCGWCDRSPIDFQWHSNSTYPIWRQRKDDPNNASGSASGYRANAHTHMHTQAHTICVSPSLEEQRNRHMCLPELLLRKGSGSDSILVGENTVNSDFIRQHPHLLCMSHSVYSSIELFFSSSHFLLCVWPGGGSSSCRGFSGTPL